MFGSLLAALAASARSREPIARADLLPLSAATFSLSRLIVHDKAESWLREPFVAEEGEQKRPKGRRLRYADRRADDAARAAWARGARSRSWACACTRRAPVAP